MAYKQVRLGDYFKFEKGLGYKGEFLVEESSVGLVGIDSQVPGGGYKENSEKPYSGPYKPEHVVDSGDVIVAATDITQDGSVLGSTFMIPESTRYETLIYSGDVMKAIPLKPDEFSLEYFYNLYRVEKYREKVAYGDTGTTVRRLSEDGICEQLVPLPDLPTQQAINEIIAIFDQQIANNKALSKSLETLAQAIFKSWFIDFDPVHAKNKGEKPFGMDDATAALFPSTFEKSDIGNIPKGWQYGPVGELISLQGGFAFKSSSWTNGGVPVIKIGSVKPGFVSLKECSYVSQELANTIANIYKLPRGSLVIGLSGYVGEVGLVPKHNPVPLLNQRVARISPNSPDKGIPFTYCLARDPMFKRDVENAANGSAQQNVSTSQIRAILRPIPTDPIILRFNSTFEKVFEQIIAKEDENQELTKLRDTLLPLLINGELEIPSEMNAS